MAAHCGQGLMLPERGRFSTRGGFYAGEYEHRRMECDESSLTLTLAAIAGCAKCVRSRLQTTETLLTVRGIGRSCSEAGTGSGLLRR